MNASPAASWRWTLRNSFSSFSENTAWRTRTTPVRNVSYSTLRTIQPSNGRPTFDEPWIAVTPPTTAFVSTYFSTALPFAAHSALTGNVIDGR